MKWPANSNARSSQDFKERGERRGVALGGSTVCYYSIDAAVVRVQPDGAESTTSVSCTIDKQI